MIRHAMDVKVLDIGNGETITVYKSDKRGIEPLEVHLHATPQGMGRRMSRYRASVIGSCQTAADADFLQRAFELCKVVMS
jgi:hypothetical protein